MKKFLASALIVACCYFSTAPAHATTIYWRDNDGVNRADLSGSNPATEVLVTGQGGSSGYLGIDLDVANDRMYFTSGSTLRRSALDGSGIVDVATGFSGISLKGVALDLANDTAYMTHVGPSSAVFIFEADLNNIGAQYTQVQRVELEPHGMKVDADNGLLYWAKGYSLGSIQRMNVDGTGFTTLINNLGSPRDVALDVANNKLYWTDAEADKIQRGNLDGTGPVEDLIDTDLIFPMGITLDSLNEKIYWADSNRGVIERSNLDGTDREIVLSGLSGPEGLFLIPTLDSEVEIENFAVPEPATGGLLSLTLLGWLVTRRSRKAGNHAKY